MSKNTDTNSAGVVAPFSRAKLSRPLGAVMAGLLCCTALATPAMAQGTSSSSTAKTAAKEKATAADAKPNYNQIIVSASLGALPLKPVNSVFGFDKTLLDTPRSASTVTSQQMQRFGVTDIYDLVSQVPGTFTNSFFGIGGALDIRGTPGQVYFMGMRRLDNPGNYPQPIGASSRIDIVRGPASPIFGPSKTGGYMNFVPITARGVGGAIIGKTEGDVSYTRSSWDGNVMSAQVRGPLHLGTQKFGYSLYAQITDSGSYYRNMSTRQQVFQGSIVTNFTPNLTFEIDGMYQNYKGQQNGGWNRLTQALVDNGTYITGTPKSLDTNGDGYMSQSEINAALPGGLSVFGTYGCPTGSTPATSNGGYGSPFASDFTNACFTAPAPYSILNLINPGTTTLSRRDVLTGPNDYLDDIVRTVYASLTWDGPNDLTIKDKFLYDGYDNTNANAYGFSQLSYSYMMENKIVASKSFTTNVGKFSFELSPSIRYTHFRHGDDYNYEYFNRVDLTQGYTPASRRLLAIECNCGWTNYVEGHYTDYSMAGLADFDMDMGLDLTFGGRYDSIDAYSTYIPSLMEVTPAQQQIVTAYSTNQGAWSWTASATYKTPWNINPYVTLSRQSTIIAGQGAELYPDLLQSNSWVSASKLWEGGIKGTFLDGTLYAALSIYEQKRTDFSIQSITVNQAVDTRGLEAEVRYAVNRHLLVTGAYTQTRVYNETAEHDGTLFSFFGAGDLVNVTNPALYYGGQPIGLVPIPNAQASRRAGIPTWLISGTATYKFDNGLAFSGSIVKVPSVFSGQSQVVRLPAYTLVDIGVSYETGPWLFRFVVKNATDARYFRANFTELFGSTIALPEVPRNFQATVKYKF